VFVLVAMVIGFKSAAVAVQNMGAGCLIRCAHAKWLRISPSVLSKARGGLVVLIRVLKTFMKPAANTNGWIFRR